MDTSSVIGIIGILIGVCGLVFVALLARSMRSVSDSHRSGIADAEPAMVLPVERRKELVEASAGQTVTLLGEPERAVRASVTLHEMFQRGEQSPWEKSGNASKILELAGGVFILKIPSKEGGKSTWLRATAVDDATGLGKFYKGSDAAPGPARQFKANGQTDPIPYQLPQGLTPDVTWRIVDIGRFNASVDGQSEIFCDGDNFPFVTSKEKGGQRWLLYLDHRKEDARGSGGLFLAEPFEPSVDITDML